jgi:hypothetical protein
MVVKNVSPQMPNGGVFDVKAYGAVGNGSTDDATAIGNCLTAAGTYAASNGGATVVFPPGKYKWNSVKEVKSDTTIYAYGAHFIGNSTAGFLKNYGSTPAAGYTTGNQRITILGGTWDGVGQSAASGVSYNLVDFRNARGINIRDAVFRNVPGLNAILLTAVEYTWVQSCRFEGYRVVADTQSGTGNAIRMSMDSSNNTCNFITMHGCHVGSAIDGSGLASFRCGIGSHEDASGKYYTGVRVIGNSFDDTVGASVLGHSWASAVISDNNFRAPGWEAVEMQVVNNTSTSRITITGNTINDPTFPGIFFNDGPFHQVAITGNVITNPTSGLQLEGLVGSTVTGNAIHNPSQVGIKLNSCSYTVVGSNSIIAPEQDGVELTTCTGCNIASNTIWDAGQNGVQLLSGSSRNTIANNHIVGCSRANDNWYFPLQMDSNNGNTYNLFVGNMCDRNGGSLGNEGASGAKTASHAFKKDGGTTAGNALVFNYFAGWSTTHSTNLSVSGTAPSYTIVNVGTANNCVA